MSNYQLLDTVDDDPATGLLTFTNSRDSVTSPQLFMRHEGDYLVISASYAALELALRLHYEEVSRTVSRLHPVAGLQTSRQVSAGRSTLALGAQPDASLLLRLMLLADAAGYLSLNVRLSPEAAKALRLWLGIAP